MGPRRTVKSLLLKVDQFANAQVTGLEHRALFGQTWTYLRFVRQALKGKLCASTEDQVVKQPVVRCVPDPTMDLPPGLARFRPPSESQGHASPVLPHGAIRWAQAAICAASLARLTSQFGEKLLFLGLEIFTRDYPSVAKLAKLPQLLEGIVRALRWIGGGFWGSR